MGGGQVDDHQVGVPADGHPPCEAAGFPPLEQTRDLLAATDRLDALGGDASGEAEREALLERVRTHERAAAEQAR